MTNVLRKRRVFERANTSRFSMDKPIYATFSVSKAGSFRNNLRRPYDTSMGYASVDAVKCVLARTKANMAVVSHHGNFMLVWDSGKAPDFKATALASNISGLATAALTREIMSSKDGGFRDCLSALPHYSGTAFQTTGRGGVLDVLLARELANAQSSTMRVGEQHFAASDIARLTLRERIQRIGGAGDNYGGYPVFFRRGSYLRMDEDIGPIRITMPPLIYVENLERVVFDGEDPVARFGDKSPDVIYAS